MEDDAGNGCDEEARIEAARQARLDRIPALRRVVASLCESETQQSLAGKIGWTPVKLAQFMTGNRNGKVMNSMRINELYRELALALVRAGFPSTEQQLKADEDAPAQQPPQPPQPPPPPPPPPPSRQPLPVYSISAPSEPSRLDFLVLRFEL